MFNLRDKKARNGKKRNRLTHMTMMIVPHGHGVPMRNYCLPMWLVRSFLALSVTCILIVGYFVSGFFYLKYVAAENKELKAVNTAQAQEINELKGLAGDMKFKLEALLKLDQEVRAKVGLTQVTPEQKKIRELSSSRTTDRYQFMTMGLGGPGATDPRVGEAMIPYIQDDGKELLEVAAESGGFTDGAGQVMELPIPEGEIDTLDELKVQLNQMDTVLTQQAESMNKLKTDVEKQIAYQKAIPSAWPVSGRITSGFGWRTNPYSHKGKEFHQGLDIAAPYGSPLRAAGDGVVIFAGWKGSWGKVVLISHGYGYVSQYAHASSILVKVGDKIQRGQVIARLGNTGRSTGPHVHFGVAKNNQWINPRSILAR